MAEWSLIVWEPGYCTEAVVQGYTKAFPHRSAAFFRRILKRLPSGECKLFLLLVDKTVRGAVLSFPALGYEGPRVWAPSYLYVEAGYRKFSIFFIAKAYRQMGNRVLCTSPSPEVANIMHKLKYGLITEGSAILPVLQAPLRWHRPLLRRTSPSGFEALSSRADIWWFDSPSGPLAVKKATRYGITIFILSYFDRDRLSVSLPALVAALFLKMPLALLIVLDRATLHEKLWARRTDRFRLMCNFNLQNSVISVLQTEITELT